MKNQNKKTNQTGKKFLLIGMFLLLFLFSGTILTFGAEDFYEDQSYDWQTETITEVVHENPLYGGNGTQIRTRTVSKREADAMGEAAVGYASEAVPYFNSVDAAAVYFRTCMRNRVNNINLAIPTTREGIVNDIVDIYQKAFSYQAGGKSTEGDYLRFAYGYIYCGVTKIRDDKSAEKWTLHYTVYYYTTAEQEKELGEAITRALQSMNLPALSEYERIKKVYDYICSHVVYDHSQVPDYTGDMVRKGTITLEAYMKSREIYTAYNAMMYGTSVCQGYATLLYRMLMEAGISNRVILGTAHSQSHVWNLAKNGQFYYNLDSTWDAGKETYSYFMKAENEFQDHVRNTVNKGNRMDYTSLEFQQEFPTAGVKTLPVSQIDFVEKKDYYEYTGAVIKPQISVPGLVQNVDYTVSYQDNLQPGTMTVTVKGINYCYGTLALTATIAKTLPSDQIQIKDGRLIYEYTGKEIKPEVIVPNLEAGVDYKVSYSSNIKPGIMKILIEGSNGWKGSKTITCQIFQLPDVGKTDPVLQTDATTTKVKVEWGKTTGATGYQLYYYHPTKQKYVEYARGSGTSCILKGSLLKPGTTMKVIVRPFYQKTITYNGYSETFTKIGTKSKTILISTKPEVPAWKSLKKSSGKITASWEKLTACQGYHIQISTDPAFPSVKMTGIVINGNGTLSQALTSVKGQKLKSGTKYYVRLRAFNKAITTKEEIYVPGAWSKTVSITY